MKHSIVFVALIVILCAPCMAATTSEQYSSYNSRIGTLIFKEIAIMEKANEVFKQWIKGDIARVDAELQLSAFIYMLESFHVELSKIAPPQELEGLHAIYSQSSATLEKSVKNHLDFVKNNELSSDRIREKINSHLIGYVQSVYDCQIRNMENQREYQEQMKLEKEPDSIKAYYSWNNLILKIMSAQAALSKDMELMLVKLSTGGIDIEEAEKEEKEIRAKAAALQKQLDDIKPDSRISELNRIFVQGYSNYLTFHTILTDYLNAPTKEKAARLQEITKLTNKLSYEFNEACSKYLQGQGTR